MPCRPVALLLALSLLAVTGCTGPEEPEPAGRTSTPPLLGPDDASGTTDPANAQPGTQGTAATGSDADAATATADGPQPPPQAVDPADVLTDPALLDQVRWLLDLLEPDAVGPDAAEAQERFGADFLEQVDTLQLLMVFAQVRAGGPYTVTQVAQAEGVGRTATVVLHPEQPELQPQIMTVSVGDEGLVEGLFFQPDTSGEVPEIGAWHELDDALAELGGTSQVVVGQVRGGSCEVVHTTAGVESGGVAAPSGSVVKLLVLSALVDAVAAGELSWDDDLTLTEEAMSLPSGILQDREPGSTVSVREAAGLMIEISDNTATDLLVGAVGQAALREAAGQAGLDQTRVMPVATTRQFFQLGWQVDQEIRDRWAQTQVPETRTALLADLPAQLDLDPAAVTQPRWQDGVDYLLTGAEVCGLLARLQVQAGTGAGEPVRQILAANPGLPVPDGTAYQGFKGGSAPGVLALALYVEPDGTPEGEGLVLVTQTRSDEAVDQLRAVTIAQGGLQHLSGGGG